jgi:meiotically up-regulated gene 157 (Mug157) protein
LVKGIKLTLQTFTEQQRKKDLGPYKFERTTAWATDGVPMGGYGYPTKPVGLISSMFRPSDDATIYGFLIPSNLFAVVSLRQAAEMVSQIKNEKLWLNSLPALLMKWMQPLKNTEFTITLNLENICF